MSTNTCMIKEEPCLSNNTPDIFNPEEIGKERSFPRDLMNILRSDVHLSFD